MVWPFAVSRDATHFPCEVDGNALVFRLEFLDFVGRVCRFGRGWIIIRHATRQMQLVSRVVFPFVLVAPLGGRGEPYIFENMSVGARIGAMRFGFPGCVAEMVR